jgi:hypothetical protein
MYSILPGKLRKKGEREIECRYVRDTEEPDLDLPLYTRLSISDQKTTSAYGSMHRQFKEVKMAAT